MVREQGNVAKRQARLERGSNERQVRSAKGGTAGEGASAGLLATLGLVNDCGYFHASFEAVVREPDVERKNLHRVNRRRPVARSERPPAYENERLLVSISPGLAQRRSTGFFLSHGPSEVADSISDPIRRIRGVQSRCYLCRLRPETSCMALLIAQALLSLHVASGQSSTTLDVRPATTDEMLTECWSSLRLRPFHAPSSRLLSERLSRPPCR